MAKDGASGQQEPTFFGISSTDTVAFVHSYAFAGGSAAVEANYYSPQTFFKKWRRLDR